jgi:secreted trypsin-like serine protease
LQTLSGDSGGGLILSFDGLWKLVGIVSANIGQPIIFDGQKKAKIVCNLDNYLVYTDVAKYNDWVYQVILETF